MIVSRNGSPTGSSCASTDGVSVTAVIRWRSSNARNGASGKSSSRAASTRQPPASNVENTSHTEASNPAAAYCSTRLVGPNRCAVTAASAVLHSPACAKSVPFGVPVDPDV